MEERTTSGKSGDSEARLCRCGKKMAGLDTHQTCASCLGLEHARLALDVPGSCQHCLAFTRKSLRRRLARQVSLTGHDPYLPTDSHSAGSGGGREAVAAVTTAAAATAAPVTATAVTAMAAEATMEASVSWGSQLELAPVPSLEDDVLELDCGENDYDASDSLLSEDEDEDDVFITPAGAAMPITASSLDGGGSAASPLPSSDMLDVCKRAASRLEIPWPAVVVETKRSRYEGKKLPRTSGAARPVLPVFPELLDEITRSWKERPYSSRSPIPGVSSLDCEEMETRGLLRMPPVEPLVASHLHPRSAAAAARSASLPSKADRFQAALTEKAYKAAALTARALNVLSLLTAYQAELGEDFSVTQDPATWEEITVVTDLCLRVQRCAVQATGRTMGTMVLQERARWLNLASLTDREKDDILDMPIVPEGVFGPALAAMQQRCEAKKRDDEALKLCLPRKPQTTFPAPLRGNSAQAAAQVPRFKIPKRPKQLTPPPQPRLGTRPAWPGRDPSPAAAAAAQPQAAPTAAFQARRKKRAA